MKRLVGMQKRCQNLIKKTRSFTCREPEEDRYCDNNDIDSGKPSPKIITKKMVDEMKIGMLLWI